MEWRRHLGLDWLYTLAIESMTGSSVYSYFTLHHAFTATMGWGRDRFAARFQHGDRETLTFHRAGHSTCVTVQGIQVRIYTEERPIYHVSDALEAIRMDVAILHPTQKGSLTTQLKSFGADSQPFLETSYPERFFYDYVFTPETWNALPLPIRIHLLIRYGHGSFPFQQEARQAVADIFGCDLHRIDALYASTPSSNEMFQVLSS